MFTKEKFLKEGKNRYIRVLDKDHFFTIQKKLLELGFKYCTVLNKDTYNESMKYFIIFSEIANHCEIHPRPNISNNSIELTDEELLIDEEGLESIEDNSWKIAIYCNDYHDGSKIIEYLTSLKPNVINPKKFDGTSVNSFYYVDSDDNCIRGRNNIPEGYKAINSSSLIQKTTVKSEPKHVGYIVFKYEEGEIFADVNKEDKDGNHVTNSLISMIDEYVDTLRDVIHKDYLSASPMNQEQIEWYKECLKQNTILDFPLKEHDKHELSKLLPKETVENTCILSKDYIEGKYYYSKFNSKGDWHEIIFKHNKNPKERAFIQLTRKKLLYDSCCSSDFFSLGEIRRFATEEEIKWLDACIKANKFIEQNEIPNVMTKIPITQIITEACLQDKPNIILENYNIKGMDDIAFADDGQLCGDAKLGSKTSMGCVGLSCSSCKINCNRISQSEALKWLFRDFQGNLQQELDDIKDSVLFRYNTLIPSIDNVKCYTVNDSEESITPNSKIKFIASEEVQVEIPKLTINKVNINFLTK